MAKGKKSFIAYADWKAVFDELPNEDAGALIKHIFAYVNDENPVSDSILLKAVFANIKSTLKRDLEKWENQLQQRIDAGKRSAEIRALNKSNEKSTVVDSRTRNSTDSVNVSVSVSDSDSVKKKKKGSIEEREKEFFSSLTPFVKTYGKKMIREFYDYWSEPNISKTKMRYEKENTWELSRRLVKWSNNDFNKTNNKSTEPLKLKGKSIEYS